VLEDVKTPALAQIFRDLTEEYLKEENQFVLKNKPETQCL